MIKILEEMGTFSIKKDNGNIGCLMRLKAINTVFWKNK